MILHYGENFWRDCHAAQWGANEATRYFEEQFITLWRNRRRRYPRFLSRSHDKEKNYSNPILDNLLHAPRGEALFLHVDSFRFVFYVNARGAKNIRRFPFHFRNDRVIYNVIYLIRINEKIINRVGTAPSLRLGMFSCWPKCDV